MGTLSPGSTLPFQWVKNDNSLAVGYKLKFFEPGGTSTPKDVYSDPNGQTSLGAELTLNSQGFAKYYLKGSYYVQFTDDLDNEIWNFPDVTGSPNIVNDEWLDKNPTITWVGFSGNLLTVDLTGDWTASNLFPVGRRTKASGTTFSDVQGEIETSVFPGPVPGYTRLEIRTDSGTPNNTINKLLVGIHGTTSIGDSNVVYKKLSTEVGVDTTKLHYPYYNVLRYGADPTGASDSRAAIQNAIDSCKAGGGGVVYIPAGKYLIQSISSSDALANGIVVPFDSTFGPENKVILLGDSTTELMAGSNNMIVLRYSDSYGGAKNIYISSNSKTGCYGFALVPEDMTQTTTVVNQNHNYFENIKCAGFDENFVLQAGPDVAGTDSGCWYNVFMFCPAWFGNRGYWLKDGPNAGASGSNRNTFIGFRVGTANMNTGVQIDAGDTNKFYSVSFEGINTGTSPNTTPTAIKILATGPGSGIDNHHNTFTDCEWEGNTQDLDNASSTTAFFGHSWNLANRTGTDPKFRGVEDASNNLVQTLVGYFHASILRSNGASGLIELNDSGNATRWALIKHTSSSASSNGIALANNEKSDGTQGDTTLPSWMIDVGGHDVATYSGSGDKVTIRRRAAAGSYGNVATFAAGGSVFGSPTGGEQGGGTVNAVAVYDDSVLLTDYVFDYHYDGKVYDDFKKAITYHARARYTDINKMAAYLKRYRKLPTMPTRKEFSKKRMSVGDLAQRLWETVEIQSLQIIELNNRLKKLE